MLIGRIVLLSAIGLVVLLYLLFWVIDLVDKIETIRERAPWLVNLVEHKKWRGGILIACLVLLTGNAVELYQKEVPAIPSPPIVTFYPPVPPKIVVSESAPPTKPQCWVKNYSAGFVSDGKQWGIATMWCNTTIKPPYSIELDYDQEQLVASPLVFPVGSEFENAMITNTSHKIVTFVVLHTIIPNEPFSIKVQGSADAFPLVQRGIIRAKGLTLKLEP